MLNKIKTCTNECIFCFVKQLPKNLRKTLYIKDDDYLLSFTKGNFITLTNLKNKDLENIIKYEFEPLYISIHSTDKELRKILFGVKSEDKALKNLKYLDDNKISTHIQIVLIPELNDASFLVQTLKDLNENYNHIESIGIVPVGITKFNKENILKPFNLKSAQDVINICDDFKENVYLADEFFILAEKELPKYSYYKNFSQLENGIGITVDFLKNMDSYLEEHKEKIISSIKNNTKKTKVLIVTSEYGSYIFSKYFSKVNLMLNDYNLNSRFEYEIGTVKNHFLGGNVKVVGLLFAKDIINFLIEKDLSIYDRILLPDIIFNNENLTLDSYKMDDFKQNFKNLKVVKTNGKSFIKELFNVR